MAILKKTLFKKDYNKVNTFITDRDANSTYFKVSNLSDTFTGGKNSFLIQGTPYLVNGTELKIEILDALGNTIYYEPAKGNPEPYEGVAKVISVHIYPDTTFGPCTITILGEISDYIDENGSIRPIPDIWKDAYNVKWQKSINVNPNLPNTTKIRFYKLPKINITEEILSIYNRTPNIVIVSSSIDGFALNPPPGSDFNTFNGLVNYQIQISDSSTFSQSMEGLELNINGLPQPYTASIVDVVTNKLAVLNVPYYETSSALPFYKNVTNFQNGHFTASFEVGSVVKDSNINSSFATIKITDLETFTGDVHRIKVYGKSLNTLGDFQLLEDVQLESADLLIKKEFSSSLNVRSGIFTEPIINSFWTTSSINTNVTYIVDDSVLTKSIKLIPSVDSYNNNGLFYFSTTQSLNFTKDTQYQLDFTPLLSASVDSYGILDVYLTGSAFTETDLNFKYGKKLATIESKTNFRRFDKQQYNFIADNTGTGELLFLIKSGVWQLSDVSLSTASETSFSPNEITLTVNVPNKINEEKFEFKFEFYDVNNNYVPVDLKKSFTFSGGNDLSVNKDITLNLSNTSFAFNSAGNQAFPEFINFNVQTRAITGSITFASAAYDDTGSLIPTNLSPYPGLLEKLDDNNWKLTSESFSGSLSQYKVSTIVYTASADGIDRFATVFRLNEGKVGQTGPGVLYRGEWSSSVDYFRTDTRRDVVLGKFWNGSSLIDRYYLCKISHTSALGQRPSDDNTENSVGTVWQTNWEEFSTTFDSVATDVLFSQDVYANRTINIGSKDGKPVIALNADYPNYDNPSISISASNYNDNGIFIGYDNGTPKLSLRGGANSLTWDGALLSISGSINATEGKIAGWIVDNQSLRDENTKIVLNPTTPFIGIFKEIDGVNQKKLDIRSGELTSYESAGGATISIDPPSIPASTINLDGPQSVQIFEYSSTSTSVTIASGDPLTYFGNIPWQNLGTIATSDSNFSGYIGYSKGIEIKDSSDNVVAIFYDTFLALDAPSSNIVDSGGSKSINITFPSAGTYTVRSFYQFSGYFAPTDSQNPTTLSLLFQLWDQANFSLSANIELSEFTDTGFQVLKNNQKYFRIKRDDTDTDGKEVIARISGRVILSGSITDSVVSDALVIPVGNIRLNNGTIITSGGGSITFADLNITNSVAFGDSTLQPPDNKPSQIQFTRRVISGDSLPYRPLMFIHNAITAGDPGFGTSNLRNLQIYSAGSNIGAIVRSASSSERYKKNIEEYDTPILDSLDKVKIKKYHYKSESDRSEKTIGIVAEDMHNSGLVDFVEYNDNKEIESIVHNNLVFALWKAIQELNDKVKELENKIENSK
jgi:hypothetical protein